MKYVGQLLTDAVIDLQQKKIKFVIDYTIPPDKGYFAVDSNILYVIREKYLETGELQLIAAAKMGKEV
ncbi:hypothetical protein [Pectinatus brassicae]|uniref:Uncharacterized protein n=1 Tax=Pectinatus brassicae TaxID=862415 RepID=A0A840USU9_9FIRM|nr:hypothetical protein [Pectinatus brassicae]MBB5337212.1 hypothetical protein [Pectinatus brassicae]